MAVEEKAERNRRGNSFADYYGAFSGVSDIYSGGVCRYGPAVPERENDFRKNGVDGSRFSGGAGAAAVAWHIDRDRFFLFYDKSEYGV